MPQDDPDQIRISFDSLSSKKEIAEFLEIDDPSDFDWEYKFYKPDRSVFITARTESAVIGTQSYLPYIFNVNGRDHWAARSERTRVSPNYRGARLFPQLMASCEEEGLKRGMEFVWGFTMAVKPFQRVGFIFHHDFLQLSVLCVKPIQLLKHLVKGTGGTRKLLAGIVAASPPSLVLQLFADLRRSDPHIGVERSPRSIADVTELYERVRGDDPLVYIKPDERFMEWFYRAKPRKKYHSFFAYNGDTLLAYVHLDLTNPDLAEIVDFCSASTAATHRVVQEVKKYLASKSHCAVLLRYNCRNPQLSRIARDFSRFGFVRLIRTGNLCIKPLTYNDMNVLNNIQPWYITRLWEPLL